MHPHPSCGTNVGAVQISVSNMWIPERLYYMIVIIKAPSLRLPGFETQLHHFIVMWPRAIVFNLSMAQLPYLYNENNDIYLLLMLWRLNELMCGKHLEECLTHNKCQPSLCFSFFGGWEQDLTNRIPRTPHNDWHIMDVSNLVFKGSAIHWLQTADTPYWQKKIVCFCNYKT